MACCLIFHVILVISSVSTGLGNTNHSFSSLRSDANRHTSPAQIKILLVDRVRAAAAAADSGVDNEVSRRLEHVKQLLRPMFFALPKNQFGRIDQPSLKYALRRHFVSTQGWHIDSLEAAIVNDESVLADRLPTFEVLVELLREEPGEHGFDLNRVGVLVTIMEQLVIEDTLKKLPHAYTAKRHGVDATLTSKEAEEVLLLHLASYIRARDVSRWNHTQVMIFEKVIFKTYPNWQQVKDNLVKEKKRLFPGTHGLSFAQVASVAEKVSGQFAHWQNDECVTTRLHLLDLEAGMRGRVRLVDFYEAALNKGRYQFTETINYLRQAGALDESDELEPQVIVPNYVIGRSNCVARTSLYSVCCQDLCENIFGELEQNVGKPVASPKEIIAAVETSRFWDSADLSDPTSSIRLRLEEIATAHGGVVVIHGRLFAQWMHLVFPRDCPYPHKLGSVYKKSLEIWEKETRTNVTVSFDELRSWVEQAKESRRLAGFAVGVATNGNDFSRNAVNLLNESFRRSEDQLVGMWSMEEELLPSETRFGENQRHLQFPSVDITVARDSHRSVALVRKSIAHFAILMLLGALWKTYLRFNARKEVVCRGILEKSKYPENESLYTGENEVSEHRGFWYVADGSHKSESIPHSARII
eukprot:TRINITY_DN22369_c0_g1_i1.p1 TRINITY_DN22369_c0_g1~~TRINITY_DN22369_c0_g1_i1.p1  ORF type:complete len:660 (+),score=80.68 TRINITY_DN22369_c0_g1_i1:57-1982(+)